MASRAFYFPVTGATLHLRSRPSRPPRYPELPPPGHDPKRTTTRVTTEISACFELKVDAENPPGKGPGQETSGRRLRGLVPCGTTLHRCCVDVAVAYKVSSRGEQTLSWINERD